MAKRKKKRKNNYQPPRNKPPRVTYVPPSPSPAPSASVENGTKEEDEFGVLDFVKCIFCGPPKDNPKPLTFGICLRRFFIVLDNLIAAAVVYYVLTWIKFYSNGADTSFDVIVDDMSILCVNNALGLFLILCATWRWLNDSDSLPRLRNFTYQEPYAIGFMVFFTLSVNYLAYWLRLLLALGLLKLITFLGISVDVDVDIRSIYEYAQNKNNTWYNKLPDYLPYWAQEVRIVILCVVFMIRRIILKDTDTDDFRIFEKKNKN